MKLFVLVSRVPYPLEKGDKLRIYHQVKELSKNNTVFLCCLNSEKIHKNAIKELEKICAEVRVIPLGKTNIYWNLFLNIFLDKPFQVAYFYQRSAAIKINKLIENFKPDHIYSQLIRTSEYVKKKFDIPKTIDYMDSLSKGMDRRAKSASFLSRPIFMSEAKRLVRYENLIFDYFDKQTIISEQDRDFIWHQNRKKIDIIRNGLDSVYFHPKSEKKEYEILFTGNMSYIPNIDSAVFLAEDILPLVKKTIPEARLLIAGANPVKKIKKLASDDIIVSGWMEDIRDAYWKSKVFVAPLRLGSGLQNKLLEAMACEIPCVTTTLANNALDAKNKTSILLAENADEFANTIIQLLQNPELAEKIAKKGRQHVIANFNWSSTTNELENLMLTANS